MDLNQITIDVSDLERSAAFYELLGLKRIVWSPDRYARFEAPSGLSTLSLHHTEGPVSGGVSIYFETDDLDHEYARLKGAGVKFAAPPKMQRWLWREAWTRDPDGHRICLYHAGPDRRFPPWRVDGQRAGNSEDGAT